MHSVVCSHVRCSSWIEHGSHAWLATSVSLLNDRAFARHVDSLFAETDGMVSTLTGERITKSRWRTNHFGYRCVPSIVRDKCRAIFGSLPMKFASFVTK